MFIIKYLKSILYIFISIMLFTILIATISYFNILNNNIINILELIAIIISIFIGGVYIGKNSCKQGYLEGLKIGLAMIVLLFSFRFLAIDKGISLSLIIFYIIVLISSILGSVLGINKKAT